MKKILLIGFSLVFLFASSSAMALNTYFGEDLSSSGTRLTTWPNAAAAEAAFLSNLTGVGTEDFESYGNGTGTPLAISFSGAGTATLNGGGSVNRITSATDTYAGRYPTSGYNYWETTSSFSISFSDAIAAFGFYGTDIGDFDGQVTLTLTNGATTSINIGNSININNASVLYFGFIDTEHSYTNIAFGNTAAGTDYFGFDDMTIGSRQQVSVPEPCILFLLGSGLIALAGLRRKIKTVSI